MEIFLKETKNVDALVFMDLEATSFTSEMIEIGAYLAEIHKMGLLKKYPLLLSVMLKRNIKLVFMLPN